MKSVVNNTHVLHVIGDPVGGARLHIHTLINGFDPSLYTVSYAYSTLAVDSSFEQQIPNLRVLLNTEVPLTIYKKPHVIDVLNIIKLCRTVIEKKVDIIHGHGAKGGLYARVVGRVTGAKTVYTLHGGVAHDMFSAFEGFIYSIVERTFKVFTNYYIFESNYTKDAFVRKFGKINSKWSVVYNGIDVSEVKAMAQLPPVDLNDQCDQKVFRVGVFGMLREQKGQQFAIRAIKKLLDNGYNVSLHLFGDGPDRMRLNRLVSSLDVGEFVYFYGDVRQAPRYMALMDAILIPSLFESFGYVALEAALIGRPVVASAVGGLLEILSPEFCEFVVAGDADSIYDGVKKVMVKPPMDKLNLELEKKGMVNRFSSQSMVDKVGRIYECIR